MRESFNSNEFLNSRSRKPSTNHTTLNELRTNQLLPLHSACLETSIGIFIIDFVTVSCDTICQSSYFVAFKSHGTHHWMIQQVPYLAYMERTPIHSSWLQFSQYTSDHREIRSPKLGFLFFAMEHLPSTGPTPLDSPSFLRSPHRVSQMSQRHCDHRMDSPRMGPKFSQAASSYTHGFLLSYPLVDAASMRARYHYFS